MWGHYGDSDYQVNYSKEIAELKSKIRILTGIGWPSKKDQIEIDSLQKQIDKLRESCSHNYEVIVLVQYRRKYCSKCDKEDYTYDPRKD